MNNTEVYFNQYCFRCKYDHVSEDKTPCDECLSNPVNYFSHKPVKFKKRNGIVKGYYTKIRRLGDYIYETWFDSLDYGYAANYYEKNLDIPQMGCTSVRKGSLYGRNLDWTYDDSAEFVVHVNYPYKFVGVAGGIKGLEDWYVKKGTPDARYKLIPFQVYDGINEYGVVANMNVVPGTDVGLNGPSIPETCELEKIAAPSLVSYILNHFETAKSAVEFIRDFASVYFTTTTHKMGYELHYMVADKDNTYCLEFINEHAVITDISDKPIMTNFYLNDVIFNDDGSVYTPETQYGGFNAIDFNHITPYGSGLERYNWVRDNIDSIYYTEDMQAFMEMLKYTEAYTNGLDSIMLYWYTEFAGINGLTCANKIEDYIPVVANAHNKYYNRSRKTAETWHTVHTSVYDMDICKLYLNVQEDYETVYEFGLE